MLLVFGGSSREVENASSTERPAQKSNLRTALKDAAVVSTSFDKSTLDHWLSAEQLLAGLRSTAAEGLDVTASGQHSGGACRIRRLLQLPGPHETYRAKRILLV